MECFHPLGSMKKGSRKWLLLSLVLLLGLGWRALPFQAPSPLAQTLPPDGPGFDSRPVEMATEEAERLKDFELERRIYRVKGERFLVSIMRSRGGGHRLHDPMYCLVGSGWSVVEQVDVELPGGSARRVRLMNAGQSLELLHWYASGNDRYTSSLRSRWRSALASMSRGRVQAPVLVAVQWLPEEGGAEAPWDHIIPNWTPLLPY